MSNLQNSDMKQVELTRFVRIDEWMWKLGLSGNEQIVVGLVNGYCKYTNHHSYEGGLAGISEVLNTSTKGTWMIVEKLCEKGIIIKTNTKVSGTQMHTSYRISSQYYKPIEKSTMESIENNTTAMEESTMESMEKSTMYKDSSSKEREKDSSCSCSKEGCSSGGDSHSHSLGQPDEQVHAEQTQPSSADMHTDMHACTHIGTHADTPTSTQSDSDTDNDNGMYFIERRWVDSIYHKQLDAVDNFRRRHPYMKLYDSHGRFYQSGKEYSMLDHKEWPMLLCLYIEHIRKGFVKIQDKLYTLIEYFNVSGSSTELFLSWCDEFDIDKVCYDLCDLYSKRDEYKGKSLNAVARGFFKQQARCDIPNV